MIEKYEGLNNVGYILDEDTNKIIAFVAIDNQCERVSTDTFKSASQANAWFDENYRGLLDQQ